METTTVSAPPARSLRYLPGLDGLRAVAVIAVMAYHADSELLPGGFLGVEVFFVLSGYLITLLLLNEFETTGRIQLGRFWLRRARRLLPALFVLLFLVLVVTALFRSDSVGAVRGDLLAGFAYVSNWYQVWTDQGYAAASDFAPLRHLWSLAVEEQFYLVWPLVMVALFRHRYSWTPALVAAWLVTIAGVVAFGVGVLHHDGRVADCVVTPDAYWTIGERCIARADALYLSTITRSSGLLVGAALAFVWRPGALARGHHRRWAPLLDALAVTAAVTLALMMFRVHFMTPDGADDVLFRGGFFFVDVATAALIAAVAHPRALAGRALGLAPLRWVGTRSYGLYLFHWPIYQLFRGVAGVALTTAELAAALVITAFVTELSFQFVERPIRTGEMKFWLRRVWYQDDQTARLALGCLTVVCVVVGSFSVIRFQRADAEPNAIAAALAEGERATVSVDELLSGAAVARTQRPTLTSPASPTGPTTPTTPSGSRAPASAPTAPPPPTTRAPTTAPSTTSAPAAASSAPATTAPPPQPTVPPTTVPPTTGAPPVQAEPAAPPGTTTPATRVGRLAIGDSVMLGAAGALVERGWVVNAAASRQMIDTVALMQQLGDAGVFGDVVVVHLGTNGTISAGSLDGVLAPLADVPRVVLLTVRADRSWTAGNNDLIRTRAGGNVVVVDWAVESDGCAGDCFEADGIHLRSDGRELYAELIQRAAG